MTPHATLPPVFVSHGSPMTALEPGAAGPFWSRLGTALDAWAGPPKAILAVSAHTLTREPVLLAAARHGTVHDFSGFPEALYRLRYDTPGAPALAQRVAALLGAAALPVHQVDEGGLDHGIWTPLRFAWPTAQVPVLPLGFPPDWSPTQLLALGRALAPLTREGVLVLGTGSITHNLQLLFGRGARPALDAPERAESAAFRGWMAERSAAADWPALQDYRRQAPHAALMHPTDEHLLPWFVTAGAGAGAGTDAGAEAGAEAGADAGAGAADGVGGAAIRLHDSLTYGCLGMDAYAFGPAAAPLAQALASAAATAAH